MSRLPKPVGKWERIGLLWLQNLLASINPKRIILQLVAIHEENSRNHEAKNWLIVSNFFSGTSCQNLEIQNCRHCKSVVTQNVDRSLSCHQVWSSCFELRLCFFMYKFVLLGVSLMFSILMCSFRKKGNTYQLSKFWFLNWIHHKTL